jgi:hypothetical protein
MGSQAENADVSSMGDAQKKFGIKQFDLPGYRQKVQQTFAPQFANLSTALARSRGSTASRMGGGSATPEALFAPAEGNYASAMSNLGGQEAQGELGGYDKQIQSDQFNAQFLNNVLGGKQAFGQQKRAAYGGAIGGKSNSIGNYLGTQSGSSIFDDILSGIGSGAQIASAFML